VTVPARDAAPRLLAIDTRRRRSRGDRGLTPPRRVGRLAGRLPPRRGPLPRVRALLAARGRRARDLSGVIVGTGPGAFTGLRSESRRRRASLTPWACRSPASRRAWRLLAAAAESGTANPVLLLAGRTQRHGRWSGRHGPGAHSGWVGAGLGGGEALVAVDLDGRAPVDALARGEAAREACRRSAAPARRERLADGRATTWRACAGVRHAAARSRGHERGGRWSRDPR
jgi:hypothetical protein